jgi:hypothetical protein
MRALMLAERRDCLVTSEESFHHLLLDEKGLFQIVTNVCGFQNSQKVVIRFGSSESGPQQTLAVCAVVQQPLGIVKP